MDDMLDLYWDAPGKSLHLPEPLLTWGCHLSDNSCYPSDNCHVRVEDDKELPPQKPDPCSMA